MKQLRLLALVGAVLVALASQADIPPRDTVGCRARRLNQPCRTDTKKSGHCESSTCSRRDYGSGMPPKLVPYECLRCVEDGADAGVPLDGGSTP